MIETKVTSKGPGEMEKIFDPTDLVIVADVLILKRSEFKCAAMTKRSATKKQHVLITTECKKILFVFELEEEAKSFMRELFDQLAVTSEGLKDPSIESIKQEALEKTHTSGLVAREVYEQGELLQIHEQDELLHDKECPNCGNKYIKRIIFDQINNEVFCNQCAEFFEPDIVK